MLLNNSSCLFISYSNGTSTTVLSNHMLHSHRININSEKQDQKQQKLTDIFISNGKPMQKSTKLSDERFILARRLVVWFARDLLPLSMVEYVGFTDFYTSLHRTTPLPTRQTLSIAALDDMYTCIKKELISKISNGGELYFS